MTPKETAALLTIAAGYDNRKPDPDTVAAWTLALDDLRFEDAKFVVVAHYRKSREWMMPADVRDGVRKLREKRLTDTPMPQPPPGLDPDDTGAYARWQQETRRAIADDTYVEPDPGVLVRRRITQLAGRVIPDA